MGRKRPAKAATASDDELIQDAIGGAQAEREGRMGSRREIREIPEDRAFEPEADDDLALFAAVRNGMDVNEAGTLLINGANANYAAADGDTALCWACSLSPAHPASMRALRMVELLVRHGAAVNQQSKSGAALARASYAGNVDAVQLLIQLGADVNQQGDDGRAALHWAVEGLGNHLVAGPPARSGSTAYHTFISTAKSLLDCGADPSIVDHRGRTAAHTAAPAQQACLRSAIGKQTLAAMAELLKQKHTQGSGKGPVRWPTARVVKSVAVLAAVAWWIFLWWMLLMVAWRPREPVMPPGPAIRPPR
jgi:hypothetical protein